VISAPKMETDWPPQKRRKSRCRQRPVKRGATARDGTSRPWYNPAKSVRSAAIIPDNPNWHRHKSWCPFYRERWCINEPDGEGGRLLYQIICLQNTPPENEAEQARCMMTRKVCWRLQEEARGGKRRATAAV
jgi:hypothetical protein